MELLEFFEQAYVINLPERHDRRRHIIRELKKQGVSFQTDNIEIFPGIRPDQPDGFPSIGARGCFLSHLQILKQSQEKHLKNVLVMEDDLAFAKFWPNEQEQIVEQLRRQKWDFVYFSHVEPVSGSSPVSLIPFNEKLLTLSWYGINGAILESLISFLEQLLTRQPGDPQGGPMHIDGAYSTFRKEHPEIVTLISCPSLGWQSSSRSDITPGRLDRIPLLGGAVSLARSVKKLLV